jgi:hypothetical protein
MIPADPNDVRTVVDEVANSLQVAVVLAGRLSTTLRADVHDADQLYNALTRATEALRRLSPANTDTEAHS